MRGLSRRVALVAALLLVQPGAGYAADVFVDAVNGVDDPSGGTAAAPFKTLTYALSLDRSDGDRVLLAPGVYDESGNGEVFPLWPTALEMSFIGAGRDRTRIVGETILDYLLLADLRPPALVEGIGFEGNDVVAAAVFLSGDATTTLRDNSFTGFRGVGTDPIFTRAGAITYYLFWQLMPRPEEVIVSPRLTLDGNRFVDNEVGFRFRTDFWNDVPSILVIDRSSVVNNVFARNDDAILFHGDGAFDALGRAELETRIVNNTLVDNVDGVRIDSSHPTTPGHHVVNNLFVGHDTAIADEPVSGRLAANLFHHSSVMVPGALDIAEVNALGSHDPSYPSRAADPLLTDRAALDVHLLSWSPAIDAGDSISADVPGDDFEGHLRPVGAASPCDGAVDIGADEAPSADIGLMRALLTSAHPQVPAYSDIYPFVPGNPLTPVLLPGVAPGDRDPDRLLNDTTYPLVLYRLDCATGRALLLTSDRVAETVVVGIR